MKIKFPTPLLLRHLMGFKSTVFTLPEPVGLNNFNRSIKNTDYPKERPLGKHCLDRHQLEVLLWESSKENEQLRAKVKRLDWWP